MGRCKNSTEGQIYLSHEKSSYSKPAQTVLMHIEDVTVDGVPTARAIFDGSTDKKDADFMEERRHRRHPQRAGREPPWQHGQQRAARRRHQGGRVQREDLQPRLRGAGKERPHHEEGDPGERWLQPVVLLLRLE